MHLFISLPLDSVLAYTSKCRATLVLPSEELNERFSPRGEDPNLV
jgi:hypothetical protein